MGCLTSLELNNKTVQVAKIKRDYIKNIAESARICPYISKVVLFGSALEERCNEDSDIDVAVFGKVSKSKIFNSKTYDIFYRAVVTYRMPEQYQEYDILYFDERKDQKSRIMQDIKKGEVLYEKDVQ